jgi:hypothetical protein
VSEFEYDNPNSELTEERYREITERFRETNLGESIKAAFRDHRPQTLRKWYVETFVYDPTNLELLKHFDQGHVTLLGMHRAKAWVSVEHAAVGTRLLYMMVPDRVVSPPDLLEPDNWRNDDKVAETIMRLFEPWNYIRYDPEGENWYGMVSPGQWKRHGKGKPSQQFVESWIARWFEEMDLSEHPERYEPWKYLLEARIAETSADPSATASLTAKLTGCVSAFKKYRHATTSKAKVREAFEREAIMFLDTNTLNQIKTITPFANGALALVRSRYLDTEKKVHNIEPGQLLPMDKEYMVTNANSLHWNDPNGQIPFLAGGAETFDGDFGRLMSLQDELLISACPTYWSFLTHAFPEVEEREAFLRLLGAAMYGTNLKIVAAMIGEPNAGKDTVMNWLTYLMPGQVATLPFSAFTPYGDEDRGFAPLIGARVATVSGEVGEGRGSKLLAEKIKTVSSGGGKIRVAEKYEKPTDIWFDGMLFLQGNSVPQISGGDRALYTNRLVAVEFKHPFPLVSRSYEAEYRLEAGAFAQVLFIHYLQYQYAGGGMPGIDPPESWRGFAKQFADAANPHGFLEACIVPSEEPVPTWQFHQALSSMVQRFGSPFQVGPNYWPKRVRALGYHTNGLHSVRKQVRKGNDLVWCYYLTVDAERSDGAFTQQQWESVLADSAVKQ